MKKIILAIATTLIVSLAIQAKETPVYTLIKNAKKIIVVQDFMLPNIDQASNIKQTYSSTLSEKIKIPEQFNELNTFICDYLNTKFKVSSFTLGSDTIYYRDETMMGKEVKVFDKSKVDADLIVRVTYKINYWGTGTEPEIIYDITINTILSFYQPKEGKMPKKRSNMGIVSFNKKNVCTLKKAPINGSLLSASYFLENYNPNQFISQIKKLIPTGIDAQYAKFKKKVK